MEKNGDQWYFNLFNDCNGVIFGDVSVDYICNNESPKLLYERFPNLKLIISLRNPVDRAISHIIGIIEKEISIQICQLTIILILK